MAGALKMPKDTLNKLLSLNGIFAIYKQKGPTSSDTLNMLKEKLLKEAGMSNFNLRKRNHLFKIGHGGTLDSNATGVLVVGIGDGTKMLTTMLSGSKKYRAVGEFGKATDTLDVTGNVTEEKSYDHITKEALEEKLLQFKGEILQVPPLFSALKKDGKRMSDLVVQGQKVEAKPARPVTVYNLSLEDFSLPQFTLGKCQVECGGGFYVRSLVDDLGKALSSCAHVKELIRVKQGQFTLEEHALKEDQWTLMDISQALHPCPTLTTPQRNAKKRKTKHQSVATQGNNGEQNRKVVQGD
ncbi:hypothetical protein DNTS_003381 [Danionella cerebrum]|uniref:Pseudouridylate synthase TRUB1 n=1 Tax=Danionella cerebrum TaxID=2873325 RepID=A0A553RAM2_9TELE|nr:hypothetical protein DNTS_003381 [Danionella translucida]